MGKILKISGGKYIETAGRIIDHAYERSITHNSAEDIKIISGTKITFGDYKELERPSNKPKILDAYWSDKNGKKIKEARIGDTIRFYIKTKNIENGKVLNLKLRDWDGFGKYFDDYPVGYSNKLTINSNKGYVEFTVPRNWEKLINEEFDKDIELYFDIQYKGKSYQLPFKRDDYLKVFKKTKVILVFYHGGPFGSGQIKEKSNDNTGHTGVIYDKIYNYTKSKELEVIGAIIAPAITQDSGVITGKKFIVDNYYPGDEIIIYGYSYGGDNAVNLSEAISQKVDTMIIVDSSDGPLRQITVDRSIPENVEYTLNIYQRKASGGFSRSGKDSDDPDSSEDSTSDGSSNTMGSRGFPHHAEGDNIVENIDVTADNTTHGTIQQRNEDIILNKLKSRINSYEHK